MKYTFYSFDKLTGETTIKELEESTEDWYIKIERGNETIYFPSCVSFSKWHGGNCGNSGAYTRAGRYKDWKVYFFLTK